MAIGDFLDKLKPGEKPEPETFLALEVTDELVEAAVWRVAEEKTEIVSLGTPVEWNSDKGTTTELVTAVDASVSSATEGLPTEPDQVIFGVPHDWADDDGIVGSRRELLKKVCRELELKPLGFVIVTDSLVRYLKMQEGTPTTSVLIEVTAAKILVVLIHLGQVKAVEVVGRSSDIAADVEEGLTRFPDDGNLPSRFIVFDGLHNLEELIQALVDHDWMAKHRFLHLPKIEALGKDAVIRSIALAGGGEVAKSIGFSVEGTAAPVLPVAPVPLAPVEDNFVVASAEDVGFVESDEVPKKVAPEVVAPPSLHLPRLALPSLSPLVSRLHVPEFTFIKNLKLPMMLPILVLLAFIAFAGAGIWFLPKASVIVTVAPHPVTEAVNLTLSTSASAVDIAGGIIPATVINQSESGSQTVPTTGKKTIGTQASGTVTVYNRSTLTKSFPAGTSLAVGSLKYTFDDSVTVASAATSVGADFSTTTTPGKASAKLTAVAIGDASNAPAGTQFTIANFSKDTYFAQNDTAIAGGTSQDVQVVGKADVDGAVKTLTDSLVASAQSDLSSQSGPGIGIYVQANTAKVDSQTLSTKIGDPAKEVTVTLGVTVQAMRYSTKDAGQLVDSAIESSLPAGFVRSTTPPSVSFGADSSSAVVTVNLLPKLDSAALALALRGKSSSAAQSSLSVIPGYQAAKVEFSPKWLSFFLKFLPFNSHNISVSVISAGN